MSEKQNYVYMLYKKAEKNEFPGFFSIPYHQGLLLFYFRFNNARDIFR